MELFHAYVVGGEREDARAHIAGMLAELALRPGTADCLSIECVNFTIDDARSLQSWQRLVPEGAQKAHVIYADFMTREAENALLKTLEEPVPDTYIIFALPKPDMLLATTLSRVRVVMPAKSRSDFAGMTLTEAQKFLKLSAPDRLAHIAVIVEKSESDEAAAEVRERTLALMNGIEHVLENDVAKNKEKLQQLLAFKKYIYTSGASSRMILETLALTI